MVKVRQLPTGLAVDMLDRGMLPLGYQSGGLHFHYLGVGDRSVGYTSSPVDGCTLHMADNRPTIPDASPSVPPIPVDDFFQLPPQPGEELPSHATEKKTSCNSINQTRAPQKTKGNMKKKRKRGPVKREKIKDGEMVKSESFIWKIVKLLGSGGFGDVYRVIKVENLDRKEYAMKTEMVEGDKRMLRLKIEVTVLKQCHDQPDPERKKHFVEFVDRGITDKFKFLVMSLVGPSLEDIRRTYLLRNYSRATAMNANVQTLKAITDLHYIGWLHRDIKPQNFAVGLGEKEDFIYMLDFGIARKIFKGDTREVKIARAKVKFLGTLRFASRACHYQLEQGRKDDLETWLYMAFDMLDVDNGLPWKRAADKKQVVVLKEKFFMHGFPKAYRIVPKEFRKVADYINGLAYGDEPDYKSIEQTLLAICRDCDINMQKKLDWIGKLKKKPKEESSESYTSSDNRQSGSDSSSGSERKKRTKKSELVKKRPTKGGRDGRTGRSKK